MGIFKKKSAKQTTPLEDATEQQKRFFDDYFREELRNHGRWYFQKVIKENGDLFKEDLESVITQVNSDLKQHVSKQLDAAMAHVNIVLKDHVTKQIESQMSEYSRTIQETQGMALSNMTDGANHLKEQYGQLSTLLNDNIAEQNSLMHRAYEDHKSQMTSMNDAQENAIKWLNQSAQSLQERYSQMNTMLDQQMKEQQEGLIKLFEENMAQTVEHYILTALGDQYDMKAQLPAIIKQLDENKQEMVDDIKL